jgi:hypothetical protein
MRGNCVAKEETAENKETATQGVSIQLVPSGQSDQPILANVTSIHPTQGMALIDFGFLDPGALNAISQLARDGKNVPERMNGRLAARVALGYDVLAGLHQQIGRVLQAVTKKKTS